MRILTFDIEEWFHILDNDSTRTVNEWKKYECRIHSNVKRVLELLETNNRKATFFCLGWIAETYPEIIREISSKGFEIGTHSRMHQLVYEQKRKEFLKDLEYSIKTLEDLTGKKVRYYRAPGFSIREDNKWAFEILLSLGIEADSSIFPAPRQHGGFPSYEQPLPSIINYNGITIKEFPINYIMIAGKPVIFSGGGYFRLFPYPFIKHWSKKSKYTMSYLHPRDFDKDQPIIKELSLARKFKSYVGLRHASGKLEKWLKDFEFMDMGSAIESINWETVPIVKI